MVGKSSALDWLTALILLLAACVFLPPGLHEPGFYEEASRPVYPGHFAEGPPGVYDHCQLAFQPRPGLDGAGRDFVVLFFRPV